MEAKQIAGNGHDVENKEEDSTIQNQKDIKEKKWDNYTFRDGATH